MHPFTLIFPLFFFSLIKYAKSDESNEIDKMAFINLFYVGLTQLENDHQNNTAKSLVNIACKIHKFLTIFERIFGTKAKNSNDSNEYLSMNDTTYENEHENCNEFKGKKGRMAKFLNFLAKTIEIGDGGMAKRRKRANRRRRKRAGPSDMSVVAIGFNLALLLIIILFALFLFAYCDPRNVRQFHSNLTRSRLLRSIPTITVNNSSSEFEQCVICLHEFIAGTKVKQLRECNHKFHVDCIKRWIFFGYNKCPLCGHQIFATPTDRF